MSVPERQEFRVAPRQKPQRLDSYLRQHLREVSRACIQRLIRAGEVTINGRVVKPSHLVQSRDLIRVKLEVREPVPVRPENIPLDIVFEDEELLVLNKPAGMVVHPAKGHLQGTLVNALMHYLGWEEAGEQGRPGIVHRLDRCTTGLMLAAKTDYAHRYLAEAFRRRLVHRTYHALVWGCPALESGVVDQPIGRSQREHRLMSIREGGRRAVTHYRLLRRLAFLSLLELRLETGRTHQIRIHMKHLHHPVFGDPQYSGRESSAAGHLPEVRNLALQLLDDFPRQALHARYLEFFHPVSGLLLKFEAPYPEDFRNILERLEDFETP